MKISLNEAEKTNQNLMEELNEKESSLFKIRKESLGSTNDREKSQTFISNLEMEVKNLELECKQLKNEQNILNGEKTENTQSIMNLKQKIERLENENEILKDKKNHLTEEVDKMRKLFENSTKTFFDEEVRVDWGEEEINKMIENQNNFPSSGEEDEQKIQEKIENNIKGLNENEIIHTLKLSYLKVEKEKQSLEQMLLKLVTENRNYQKQIEEQNLLLNEANNLIESLKQENFHNDSLNNSNTKFSQENSNLLDQLSKQIQEHTQTNSNKKKLDSSNPNSDYDFFLMICSAIKIDYGVLYPQKGENFESLFFHLISFQPTKFSQSSPLCFINNSNLIKFLFINGTIQ